MTLREYYTNYEIIARGAKYGVKNIRTGSDIIPARYSAIQTACTRYADQICFLKVKEGEKYFLCNMQGKRVTQKVDYIGEFNCGIVSFKKNDKWGFINEDGKIFILPKYVEVEKLDVGKFKVKFNNKWGIVDNTGEIIKPEYDNIIIHDRRIFGIKNKQMISLII